MEPKLPPFFHEVFDPSLPRLGPGSPASTRRAFNGLFPGGAPPLRILDMGCGTGAQTLELARLTGGSILAVDNHQPYLDELMRRADVAGLSGHIAVQLADMESFEVEPKSFDLIWFEGSIFVIGFEKGLKKYRTMLNSEGRLAFSDLVWLSDDPPEECRTYMEQAGAILDTVPATCKLIESCGYSIIDHFTLPESDWLKEYFAPMELRLNGLRPLHQNDPEKLGLIDYVAQEISLYRKHSKHYGYEFFLMRKS